MTDLAIRRMILDEISTAIMCEDESIQNKDDFSIIYFQGYQDGLRNLLTQIESNLNKELDEMEKQENG